MNSGMIKNSRWPLMILCLLSVGCQQVIEVESGESPTVKDGFSKPLRVVQSGDKMVAGYEDGQVWVYSSPVLDEKQSATPKTLDGGYELSGADGNISAMALSSDGHHLVAISSVLGNTTGYVWSDFSRQNNKARKISLAESILPMEKVAFSADGKKFTVTVPADNKAYLFDIESLAIEARLDFSRYSDINFSGDKTMTADFLPYDTDYGQVIRMISVFENNLYLYEVVLTKNGVANIGYNVTLDWKYNTEKNWKIKYAHLAYPGVDKNDLSVAVVGETEDMQGNGVDMLARFTFAAGNYHFSNNPAWSTVELYSPYDKIELFQTKSPNTLWDMLYFGKPDEYGVMTGVTGVQTGYGTIPSFQPIECKKAPIFDAIFSSNGEFILMPSSLGSVFINSRKNPGQISFQTPLKKRR